MENVAYFLNAANNRMKSFWFDLHYIQEVNKVVKKTLSCTFSMLVKLVTNLCTSIIACKFSYSIHLTGFLLKICWLPECVDKKNADLVQWHWKLTTSIHRAILLNCMTLWVFELASLWSTFEELHSIFH